MLEAADLQCARGGRTLFRGLSFTLAAGELLRVAGANGSGKTSLLRILCGLLAPASGEVRWAGKRIEALKEEYCTQLVYLGHAAALKEELTAQENLGIACSLAGNRKAAGEIRDALGLLEVPQTTLLKKLSQGQRRRAALARLVLSGSAPLWLLDEPFAALDAQAARIVEGLISAHVEHGGAVVYTTHQEARLEGRVISLDG